MGLIFFFFISSFLFLYTRDKTDFALYPGLSLSESSPSCACLPNAFTATAGAGAADRGTSRQASGLAGGIGAGSNSWFPPSMIPLPPPFFKISPGQSAIIELLTVFGEKCVDLYG